MWDDFHAWIFNRRPDLLLQYKEFRSLKYCWLSLLFVLGMVLWSVACYLVMAFGLFIGLIQSLSSNPYEFEKLFSVLSVAWSGGLLLLLIGAVVFLVCMVRRRGSVERMEKHFPCLYEAFIKFMEEVGGKYVSVG